MAFASSHITYFHKGALVYNKEPWARSLGNLTGLGLAQNSLPCTAKLVFQDASKLNKKIKITSSGTGEE